MDNLKEWFLDLLADIGGYIGKFIGSILSMFPNHHRVNVFCDILAFLAVIIFLVFSLSHDSVVDSKDIVIASTPSLICFIGVCFFSAWCVKTTLKEPPKPG